MNREPGGSLPDAQSHSSTRGQEPFLNRLRSAKIKPGAKVFPYVNGSLFSGSLDWTKINPDIFSSMIQVVADAEERGTLSMHYISVSNILKVLNPLFLDELRDPAKMPAQPTTATTRRSSASTSAAASRTTPSAWKSSLSSTRR